MVHDSPIFVNRFSDARTICHEPHNATFEDHYHHFHEIVCVHHGHATHVINGKETKAFPGEVFLIKPGMRHHFRDAVALSLTNVMFIRWRLAALLEELREMPGFAAFFLIDTAENGGAEPALARVVLTAEEQAVVRDITDRMLAENEQRAAGYKSALRGMLVELLVLIARARRSPGNARSNPAERLALLVSSLEERFFEPWPLERMADVAGCSVPSLSRHFRSFMKSSPTDYLISLRISRAKELLLHTDFTVTQIAEHTGFADSSYLTRQFRKRVGPTPRAYRRGITGSHYP